MKRVTFEVLERDLAPAARLLEEASLAVLRPSGPYTGPLAGLTEEQAKELRRMGKRISGALMGARREGVINS